MLTNETVKFLVPTYGGDEPDGDNFGGPQKAIEVSYSSGLRIILGTDEVAGNAPDVLVERRKKGWAIAIHPVGWEDPVGFLYILDDGKTYFQPEAGNTEPLVVLDPADAIPQLE